MNHAVLTTTAPPTGDSLALLTTRVSYGTDIRRPAQLETRTTGELLRAVRDGEWSEAIQQLRALPDDSSAQRKAKLQLPYVTWAGEFSRRDGAHLVQHAGQVGIDLDHLAPPQTQRVMHVALDDQYCLAAFRSARGQGVRLLVRVPLVETAAQHVAVYAAAAAHVRLRYDIEPDVLSSDIARASFVSWDGGLWLNPAADMLPIPANAVNAMIPDHCVNPRSRSGVPWWVWLARECLPYRKKPDGTVFTHHTLLQLGRRLALRATREKQWLIEVQVEQAALAWLDEARRRGLRVRRKPEEYFAELMGIVEGAWRCRWFKAAASRWTRWTQMPDFPSEPKDRLLYAIRRHCEEANMSEFFMSCRDAGTISETSHVRAAELLKDLAADGRIVRVRKPRPARHAITYRLLLKVSENPKSMKAPAQK